MLQLLTSHFHLRLPPLLLRPYYCEAFACLNAAKVHVAHSVGGAWLCHPCAVRFERLVRQLVLGDREGHQGGPI
jgi:hypothetical protein